MNSLKGMTIHILGNQLKKFVLKSQLMLAVQTPSVQALKPI